MRRAMILGLAVSLAFPAAHAAGQDEPIQSVQVVGVKDRTILPYRALVAGLDAFDANHRLAPAVPQLEWRITIHGASAEQALDLRIEGDGRSLAVPLRPDGLFVVPRDEQAYDSRANVVLNRKNRSFQLSPEIRTPGLPANVRRLGDLRLNCKVAMAIGKELMPFWMTLTVNGVLRSGDWCSKLPEKDGMSYRAPRKLAGATLSSGERTAPLHISGNSYTAPIADASWSDDALIELQYAAE